MVLRRTPIDVRRNILPLADLAAQTIPTEYLQIPSDITLALALLYGIGPDAPHLLQTDKSGNLKVVNPAGSGAVLYDSFGNVLSTGNSIQANANTLSTRLFDNAGASVDWYLGSLATNKRPRDWSTLVTIWSSSAVTTSGVGSGFSMGQYQDVIYYLGVTAASGTSPVLNCFIDSSPDNGVTWFQQGQIGPANITAAPAMPAPGYTFISSPAINGCYQTVRLRFTVTGTTPSFTIYCVAIAKPS